MLSPGSGATARRADINANFPAELEDLRAFLAKLICSQLVSFNHRPFLFHEGGGGVGRVEVFVHQARTVGCVGKLRAGSILRRDRTDKRTLRLNRTKGRINKVGQSTRETRTHILVLPPLSADHHLVNPPLEIVTALRILSAFPCHNTYSHPPPPPGALAFTRVRGITAQLGKHIHCAPRSLITVTSPLSRGPCFAPKGRGLVVHRPLASTLMVLALAFVGQ